MYDLFVLKYTSFILNTVELHACLVPRGQIIPTKFRTFPLKNDSTFDLFFISIYKYWMIFKTLWAMQKSNWDRSILKKNQLVLFCSSYGLSKTSKLDKCLGGQTGFILIPYSYAVNDRNQPHYPNLSKQTVQAQTLKSAGTFDQVR